MATASLPERKAPAGAKKIAAANGSSYFFKE